MKVIIGLILVGLWLVGVMVDPGIVTLTIAIMVALAVLVALLKVCWWIERVLGRR